MAAAAGAIETPFKTGGSDVCAASCAGRLGGRWFRRAL